MGTSSEFVTRYRVYRHFYNKKTQEEAFSSGVRSDVQSTSVLTAYP